MGLPIYSSSSALEQLPLKQRVGREALPWSTICVRNSAHQSTRLLIELSTERSRPSAPFAFIVQWQNSSMVRNQRQSDSGIRHHYLPYQLNWIKHEISNLKSEDSNSSQGAIICPVSPTRQSATPRTLRLRMRILHGAPFGSIAQRQSARPLTG